MTTGEEALPKGLAVGSGDSSTAVGTETEAGDGALAATRILEHVDGAQRVVVGPRQIGRVQKVLLVDVDGVVLLDVVLHGLAQVEQRRRVRVVLLHFLAETRRLVGLLRVDVARPATLAVVNAARLAHGVVRVDLGPTECPIKSIIAFAI